MTTTEVESRPAPGLPDRMLHARDLAPIFGVSVQTIWLWKGSGKLPAPIQIGRAPVWHPDVIAEFLRHGGANQGHQQATASRARREDSGDATDMGCR